MLHKKLIGLVRNAICIVGFFIITPFLLLAGLGLLLEDGLPILFLQDRIGQHKKIFRMIKIRTLKNSTPQTVTHKLESKHRLRVGALIRKIKLDEFPQLLNVIKGEINLVGPRPGLPNDDLLLEYRSDQDIFKVKPGITGLSQVMGYDMSDSKRLSEIDKLYVCDQSFKIDALILLATFINTPKTYLAQHFKIEDISSIK